MIKVNIRCNLDGDDEAVFLASKQHIAGGSDTDTFKYMCRRLREVKEATFSTQSLRGAQAVSMEEMNRRYQTGEYPKKVIQKEVDESGTEWSVEEV